MLYVQHVAASAVTRDYVLRISSARAFDLKVGALGLPVPLDPQITTRAVLLAIRKGARVVSD